MRSQRRSIWNPPVIDINSKDVATFVLERTAMFSENNPNFDEMPKKFDVSHLTQIISHYKTTISRPIIDIDNELRPSLLTKEQFNLMVSNFVVIQSEEVTAA